MEWNENHYGDLMEKWTRGYRDLRNIKKSMCRNFGTGIRREFEENEFLTILEIFDTCAVSSILARTYYD
jgi:hypothetical protein